MRKNRLTPDTLSERWMRTLGWYMDQCHRQVGMVSHDLFGFADQYGFYGDEHVLVQSTGYSNISARRKKIEQSEMIHPWLRGRGNRVLVIGWKHLGTDQPIPIVEEVDYAMNEIAWRRVTEPRPRGAEIFSGETT